MQVTPSACKPKRLFSASSHSGIGLVKKIAPSEAVQAANGIADQEPQAQGVPYMKKPKLIVCLETLYAKTNMAPHRRQQDS